MKQLKILLIAAIVLMIGGLLLLFYGSKEISTSQNPTQAQDASSDTARLAKALKDSGAVLYCSKDTEECKQQLALFGGDSQILDYVECDAKQPDANSEECSAHQVDVYPTWIYQNQKTTGLQDLAALAKLVHLNDN